MEQRFYVFFRTWERFSADFSDFSYFEKFNDLPDDEINDALEAHMVKWRREHKSEFDRRVRERANEVISALRKRAKQRMSRPGGPVYNSRRAESIPLEPGPECSLGCRNAYKLGWITTMLHRFGDPSPSPQKFFIHAPSRELATALVKRLTTQWPANIVPPEDDWREYLALNLRFGFLSAQQLGVEGQTSAEEAIKEMAESKRGDWIERLQRSCAAEATRFGQTMLGILRSEAEQSETPADATPVADQTDTGDTAAPAVETGEEHEVETTTPAPDLSTAEPTTQSVTQRSLHDASTVEPAEGQQGSKGSAGKREPSAELAFAHSPDFRSVRHCGDEFSFTKQQAAIVKMLWGAWEKGTPDVGAETLLEKVGSKTSRLIDGFRDHPAWKTMIVAGDTKGSLRIADDPPES